MILSPPVFGPDAIALSYQVAESKKKKKKKKRILIIMTKDRLGHPERVEKKNEDSRSGAEGINSEKKAVESEEGAKGQSREKRECESR